MECGKRHIASSGFIVEIYVAINMRVLGQMKRRCFARFEVSASHGNFLCLLGVSQNLSTVASAGRGKTFVFRLIRNLWIL